MSSCLFTLLDFSYKRLDKGLLHITKYNYRFLSLLACPEQRFDIRRTCLELGEWCNDFAAIDGCLDCTHCDIHDRSVGKCPECLGKIIQ